MQGESVDPRMTLDDEDEKREKQKPVRQSECYLLKAIIFSQAFVLPLVFPLLIFRQGKVSINSQFQVVS